MDPTSVVTHTGKLRDGNRARTALHALTQGPLDESRPRKTIRRALQSICESFDWKSGLVSGLDEQSSTLHHVESWHESSDAVAQFKAISERQTFACGIGFCGRVWHSGRATWIPNIIQDASFMRAKAVSTAGLHTTVEFPLEDANHMVGVMELYSDRIRKADQHLHDQVGQALTALNLNLRLVQRHSSTGAADGIASRLEKCIALIEDIAGNIRDLAMALHPASLKNDGPIAALRWSAERSQKRVGVITTVVGEEPTPHLRQKHGWGIQIMRECLAAVGGCLYVLSAISRGTRFVAEAAR